MASRLEIFGEPAATARPDAGPAAHCDRPAPEGRALRILAEEGDIRLEWSPALQAERTVGGSTYRVYVGADLVAECYTRPGAEEAYRRALATGETVKSAIGENGARPRPQASDNRPEDRSREICEGAGLRLSIGGSVGLEACGEADIFGEPTGGLEARRSPGRRHGSLGPRGEGARIPRRAKAGLMSTSATRGARP